MPRPPDPARRAVRPALAIALAAWAGPGAALAQAPAVPPAWLLVGHQGLMRVVIVPDTLARDRAAYQAEIDRLCAPERTCFINFFTNTTGVPLALPLPDDVAAQATARYRFSAKNGVKLFQWACRVQQAEGECF